MTANTQRKEGHASYGHTAAGAPDDRFTLYLSGSIRKGDTDQRDPINFWTEDEISALTQPLRGLDIRVINPATAGIRRGDYWANFGCDLYMVANSDVMVVDARTEKGIGVGGEMMFAHSRDIPVVTVAPWNTNYRREFLQNICGEDLRGWIHPFVFGLSNAIVDSFEAAGALIKSVVDGTEEFPKHRPVEDAMSHYRLVSRSW